jgi:hypothetical protein
MTITVYRAALGYARRGIPVFPCRANRKEPATTHGFADASTEPAQIERWFRSSRANIGIPTGLRSGLFVLDIDRHSADGMRTIGGLEQTLGALPQTTTARTAGGGEHRYFRMPGVTLRNSAGKLGPGVDTRGEGGYVVAAPSAIDGVTYRYTVRVRPAELPQAWIDALTPRERPSEPIEPWAPQDDRERTRAAAWCVRALQDEARELAAAPPGTRNDRLWRAAAALGGLVHAGAITSDDVHQALTWACSTWGRRDARKDLDTIHRGLAFGLANPRQIHLGDDRAA